MEDPAAVRRRMHAELTEEERWAEDRTGWPPQFEKVKDENGEEDEPTLLDHQTWIDSKLDDKYYGGKVTRFCSTSTGTLTE